jgi:protease I
VDKGRNATQDFGDVPPSEEEAMRVLVISADKFEDSELTQPVVALQQAEVNVDIASLEAGTISGKKGTEVQANLAVADANTADYDMLLLPGGKAPARLRESETVLDLVRGFMDSGKPIAAICHGPQILISAGLVKGRRMTSYQAVGKELQAAGANYVDQEVVIDGNFITSRQPSDLSVFIDKVLDALRQHAPAV